MQDLIGKTIEVGDYVILAECLPITAYIAVLRIKKVLEDYEDGTCMVIPINEKFDEWKTKKERIHTDHIYKISAEDAMLCILEK
jgi:hypothetical protein